jgi:hypothetical protein
MASSSIPIIDPNVRHVGVSKLRELNATKLKENDQTLVIQDNDNPLAVLLSYERYLIIQQQLLAVYNTVELLMDEKERKGLTAGLADIRAGRLRSLAEIESELERKK